MSGEHSQTHRIVVAAGATALVISLFQFWPFTVVFLTLGGGVAWSVNTFTSLYVDVVHVWVVELIVMLALSILILHFKVKKRRVERLG